jgi:hypothetical protein
MVPCTLGKRWGFAIKFNRMAEGENVAIREFFVGGPLGKSTRPSW